MHTGGTGRMVKGGDEEQEVLKNGKEKNNNRDRDMTSGSLSGSSFKEEKIHCGSMV